MGPDIVRIGSWIAGNGKPDVGRDYSFGGRCWHSRLRARNFASFIGLSLLFARHLIPFKDFSPKTSHEPTLLRQAMPYLPDRRRRSVNPPRWQRGFRPSVLPRIVLLDMLLNPPHHHSGLIHPCCLFCREGIAVLTPGRPFSVKGSRPGRG